MFFKGSAFNHQADLSWECFCQKPKQFMYTLVLFTQILFFLNGNNYIVATSFPGLCKYFIGFSLKTSSKNIRTLDLNTILDHWLIKLQSSCENIVSHRGKDALGT
jgi:hypothetical protein